MEQALNFLLPCVYSFMDQLILEKKQANPNGKKDGTTVLH